MYSTLIVCSLYNLQRDSSPSGIEGKIIFTAQGGSVELYIACPLRGKNAFKVTKNDIPGINAEVTHQPPDSGHPTIGTLQFKKK